jgi:hypothetical protein
MPTAVRDASSVTTRNRDIAQFAYYAQWKNATMTTGGARANAALNAPVVAGANLISDISSGDRATYVFNNEFVKRVPAVSSFFSTLGPDPNTSLYPPNESLGGAGRSF